MKKIIINNFYLVLALALLASAAARAEPGSPCPGFFSRFFPGSSKLDVEKYLTLSKNKIADYFPESELTQPLPGMEVKGARISPEQSQKFRAEFDALLEQRASAFNFPKEKFREWLKAKSKSGEPYPDLDPVMIEQAFKSKEATLEDYQNAYFLSFVGETQKKNPEGFLKKLHPREFARIGLTVAKKIGVESKNILKGAIIAGPIAGVINAFTSAPMKPILESSEQSSNILFADVAQAIQRITAEKIKHLQEHVSELASATDALDQYHLEGMDRGEAKRIMDQFEDRYYRIFLRMSGFMPPFKRTGRDIIRDWLINQPLQMANHATTFNMEFTMNQMYLSALEEKIKNRDGKPTSAEAQLIEQYTENMESAENRLALTLASWKIYTFAFAEIARDPLVKESNATLTSALNRYEKFMNMDKYRSGLSSKVKEAFHNFDPSFAGVEHIAPNLPAAEQPKENK